MQRWSEVAANPHHFPSLLYLFARTRAHGRPLDCIAVPQGEVNVSSSSSEGILKRDARN